jgi:protein TonB
MHSFTYLFIFILLAFFQNAFSQNGQSDTLYEESGKMHITITPLYPGKEATLLKDIGNTFKIPQNAIKDNIHGTLLIEFTVDTFGFASNTKIIKSLREDIDQAAIEMIKKLKRFAPATMDNKKVPFTIKLPLKI